MTPTIRPDITRDELDALLEGNIPESYREKLLAASGYLPPADNTWARDLTNRELHHHLTSLMTSKGRFSFAQRDAMLRELLDRFHSLVDAGALLRHACNEAGNPVVPSDVSLAIARVTTAAHR